MDNPKDSDAMKDLAAQYFDLWQKQLLALSDEKQMQDTAKLMQEWQNQTQAALQSVDTPEKSAAWLQTWADSWKSQFENGSAQTSPFTQRAAPTGTASQQSAPQLDDLLKRIEQLEQRIAVLENKPPKKGR